MFCYRTKYEKCNIRTAVYIVTIIGLILSSGAAEAGSRNLTAFVDVRIIPMTRDTIVFNQSVIVADGRIHEIGNVEDVAIPTNAFVIPGEGAYLLPGLADMHTHLFTYDSNPSHLVLYLAHGVTSVRAMSGVQQHLVWRDGIEEGLYQGPSIYTSGPVLSGFYNNSYGLDTVVRLFRIAVALIPFLVGTVIYGMLMIVKRFSHRAPRGHARYGKRLVIVSALLLVVIGVALSHSRLIPFMLAGRFIIYPDYYVSETPSQAVREVRRQMNAGYDLLKVYDFLTEAEYLAAVEEAEELGLYTSGHLPDQIALETLLSSGQDEIAHVDELQSFHWIGYNRGLDVDSTVRNKRFSFDFETIPHTVDLVVKNDINAVSTLVTKETMYRLIENSAAVFASPEYRFVKPEILDRWKKEGRQNNFHQEVGDYRRESMQPFLSELTLALHEAGVIMATGTDVSVEGIVPGHHLIRELELLTEVGLTPFEALEMGTRNAGIIIGLMGKDGDFGVIDVGKRADFVLLGGNPLDDITNLNKLIGVMASGRWYTRSKLDSLVGAYMAGF